MIAWSAAPAGTLEPPIMLHHTDGLCADALHYVLPPIKNWRPFCSEQLQRQIICTSKCLYFQEKWIDTITMALPVMEFQDQETYPKEIIEF